MADAENQSVLVEAFRTALETKEPGRVELEMKRRDGTSFVADVAFAVMADNQNAYVGIVCSIRDVSERKRIEEGLRQALERERELNDLKSRFSSMVSHEFRTPLSVILSSSDLLRSYSDRMTPERRDQQLESIQQQVRRLANMLDDILALGKAQSVGLDLSLVPVNVRRFCEDIVTELRPTAASHTFHFEARNDCYDTYADLKLLRQAVTNLLSNAVKYSPEGSTVYTRLNCDGEQIHIEIEDEGSGISKEDQQHLFEAFFRAKNVLAIPGSGLGLSIVKQAIEAHGGSITCDSEIGEGTTFTLQLPITHEDTRR
ncbi:MAG: ATP-binding protein [Anaerolineae bacterium]